MLLDYHTPMKQARLLQAARPVPHRYTDQHSPDRPPPYCNNRGHSSSHGWMFVSLATPPSRSARALFHAASRHLEELYSYHVSFLSFHTPQSVMRWFRFID